MPESPGPFERWRRLGRFLPDDVRERVFEPALGDLVYQWMTRTQRRPGPFGLYALGTFLGCAPIALPRLFVREGRMTRLGRAAVWSTAVLTSLALLLMNMRQAYNS